MDSIPQKHNARDSEIESNVKRAETLRGTIPVILSHIEEIEDEYLADTGKLLVVTYYDAEEVNKSARWKFGINSVRPDGTGVRRVHATLLQMPDNTIQMTITAPADDWQYIEPVWVHLVDELRQRGFIAEDAEPKQSKPDVGPKEKLRYYLWAAVEIGNRNSDPNAVFDEWYRLYYDADPDDLNTPEERRLRKNFKQQLKYHGTVFEWPTS